MLIGQVAVAPPVIMAPLAGITNLPFRLLAKAAGCGLVCSEMVSANGLVHGSPKTLQLLASSPQEKPLSVQIFGADPDILAAAAQQVEASGADLIDINFGCAVKKVLKTGSGAALMREPFKAEKLLKTVRKAIRIPLTIKIRSGWEPSGSQAMRIAEIAGGCGVDAIAVHPRTAQQGFGGRANWSIIAAVQRVVAMPVIGNGDIVTAPDAARMFHDTGCSAVMIGRRAIGRPWFLAQVRAHLTGESIPEASDSLRFSVMRDYLEANIRSFGELNACRRMRSHLGWFAKGLPHSSAFREHIKQITTGAEARQIIAEYQRKLKPHPIPGALNPAHAHSRRGSTPIKQGS